MVQLASYLRRVLCKTRLIFPRINGPNVEFSLYPLSVPVNNMSSLLWEYAAYPLSPRWAIFAFLL